MRGRESRYKTKGMPSTPALLICDPSKANESDNHTAKSKEQNIEIAVVGDARFLASAACTR